ncbi:zinc finger CCHC domain-containing protein 7-like [Cloeon dipterum]|uniref:zinc finger CCHC domain-containing protein 7-like n=1 Tax=Cloeon dipterum TaxID=197152 RepID=UPI0032208DE7
MADDEDVCFLWSGVPAQHRDVPLVTLDSPPYSPPEENPSIPSLFDISVPCPPFIAGFENIDMTTFVPMEPLITPEGSDTLEPAAVNMKKEKRKRKKKNNVLLVSKMVEQIKEAGVLERNNLGEDEEATPVVNVKLVKPKEKWTRYFEADLPQQEEQFPVTARDIRKAAEKAERLSRIQRGRVSKLSRNRRKPAGRCLNCHQYGHMKFECPDPIKVVKCHLCAGVGHYADSCPKSMCLLCGAKTNEFSSGCRNCRFMYRLTCTRCNNIGHESNYCPDLWRRFYDTVDGDGISVNLSTKTGRSSLKPSHKLYCSWCAKRGHTANDCSRSPEEVKFCGASYVTSLLSAHDFELGKKSANNSYKKRNRNSRKSVQVMKRFKRDLRS